MTKKTVKSFGGDLEKLKDEFDALKRTCDELSAKYEGLEKKCLETVSRMQ